MELVEDMACQEPLCARSLGLSTARSAPEINRERWRAMGKEPPKVSFTLI